jgi:SAM-dependent methyltransferase
MSTDQSAQTWASPAAADAWQSGAARRATTLAHATERLLDAARLGPGLHVLDLAAGTGDQTLLAAQRVLPGGTVLASDISPSMLDAARQAAAAAGLTNIDTLVADAAALDLEEARFDAAICRFGLMFVSDLHQTLLRLRHTLRPGARFAALVWSSAERNPYLALQIDLVREMGRMPEPPPSVVRTVSLSGPGLLAGALTAAGFTEVSVAPVPTPREFSSLEDALSAMRTTSPAQAELQQAMSSAERAEYAARLADGVRAYVQPDGRCSMPGEALLAAATRP